MPDRVLRDAALERVAEALDSTGAYRVTRRFRLRQRYADRDGTPTLRALFVDAETTGLDTATDSIIQLAVVPFEYAPLDGRIFAVDPPWVRLEDPGRPIPPDVTALTGISDADVAGRRIDDAAVRTVAAGASLVIAHNAGFDRPLVERRLPWFRELPWACSCVEVPWARHGIASAKLDYLLYRHCQEFFDGHRADEDALAGVHALATPFGDCAIACSSMEPRTSPWSGAHARSWTPRMPARSGCSASRRTRRGASPRSSPVSDCRRGARAWMRGASMRPRLDGSTTRSRPGTR